MRAAILLWALAAGCDQKTQVGGRCAMDPECVPTALCDDGHCRARAAVERKRRADVEEAVQKARESIEAIGMRVQQGVEALEEDRADASVDAGGEGHTGGGTRSRGTAEKTSGGYRVEREDYQRRAAGKK